MRLLEFNETKQPAKLIAATSVIDKFETLNRSLHIEEEMYMKDPTHTNGVTFLKS